MIMCPWYYSYYTPKHYTLYSYTSTNVHVSTCNSNHSTSTRTLELLLLIVVLIRTNNYYDSMDPSTLRTIY